MNLQVLVAVAEIVSALAVTFTLIALIVSIWQNTTSQKALVVDSLAAAIASINVPAMESHVLGSAKSKAMTNWGSASREERIMAHYFLFSFFKLSENAWYQQKAGVLIRRCGLDGRHCFENITTALVCVGCGGRVANMLILQNFKDSFQEQSRRASSAT